MKHKTIIKALILGCLLTLINSAYARYVPSPTLIVDNNDALNKCPVICYNAFANWTGSWWTTADPVSVCECFHGWPYCPIIKQGPPPPICVPMAMGSGPVIVQQQPYVIEHYDK